MLLEITYVGFVIVSKVLYRDRKAENVQDTTPILRRSVLGDVYRALKQASI